MPCSSCGSIVPHGSMETSPCMGTFTSRNEQRGLVNRGETKNSYDGLLWHKTSYYRDLCASKSIIRRPATLGEVKNATGRRQETVITGGFGMKSVNIVISVGQEPNAAVLLVGKALQSCVQRCNISRKGERHAFRAYFRSVKTHEGMGGQFTPDCTRSITCAVLRRFPVFLVGHA